ncbi:osmosensitive potassium channel sensor histidine kinase KdpD, KdpD and USP_OKCHK domain-containing [Citrifermentans bemidjiense Bem]|uniref:histidine kinase n=1 Tax=Citrifermentans bemidjiense (strain ATCC BAA-1014 / DSM 16622 / JCM 12645 / Bem) TaxID=404380 RepID=B5EH77_CITBB|nr:sensor histidine kinase KdpD [Citrifermentans bemidjiense]ACH39613.1 osmosensitive potassium channel sensor histidine kinase KdpD, KdpD and USP_OKCHK domain-containing [Citrifermentans bemidjiense Bem]
MRDDAARPSPETLLKVAKAEEEAQSGRGKLKIFLGYAPGVGKTYAMLEAAQMRKREGRDVVAAYVESHGRAETDLLLEGLEVIPKLRIEYQGVQLSEMDIDTVLARKPQIALVDELAHTNAVGSRHEKRWQDVEELIYAGIDVYTTVNVQHFDSLNDIVAQITGVVVRETVPDKLLDLALEIRVVDIPPEDLLERLREGKVYIPEKAMLATEKFFKPGNLMALRELSLRRAASRVDDQMRAYMEARSIAGPWPAAEKLLVCVSGSPYSEKLIRTTRRLADEVKARWHTVYIETPGLSKHARENRERVWRDLRLAESLGAEVATLSSASVAQALVEFAVHNNVTKIVVGKPKKPRWREFLRQPLVDEIIRLSGPVDVYVVSIAATGETPKAAQVHPKKPVQWTGYLKGSALVVAVTLLCKVLQGFLAPTNLMMIYLLGLVLAATKLGRRPAVLTALLSVLAFDFFFVPPRLTFAVADTEYLITFIALFTVGFVISTLVSQTRERAESIREREEQTATLYYLSRDLTVASDLRGILAATLKNIEDSVGGMVAVLLPEGERLELQAASGGLTLDTKEHAVADWSFRNSSPAGRGTETLGSSELLYLPLLTSGDVLGVLGVRLKSETEYTSPLTRRLLHAFATQTAFAIERVLLVKQAEQAQILRARENLERALLNSISHDLRTPLVSISGALGALRDRTTYLEEESRRDLLEAAWEEAGRLNRFVGNLLDMTRLEAGAMKPKRVPSDLQDLIGCALASLEPQLSKRKLTVRVDPGLPLVSMDMVLMTQVLVNLLDNALKYAPSNELIELESRALDGKVTLKVADRGPGVPPQDLERIFDKFYRVPVPEGAGGTGLGLSICKGIVEAHGGTIHAENREGGGLKITVQLPVEGEGHG